MEKRPRLLLCMLGIGAFLSLPTAGFARQQAATPAALGPVAVGDEAKHALIYFYRDAGWAGRALEPRVLLDDVELVKMDNKRYFSVWVEPGQHSLSAGGGWTQSCRPPLRSAFEPGMVYFVKIQLMFNSCYFTLPIPDHAAAKTEMSKLKPLNTENFRHPAVRVQ
jgi:uncharacterized protein DUF2846